MRVGEAWALLGLVATDDPRAVKRAYARLLKQINVDADPSAFIHLREARDLALSWGAELPEWESESEPDWDWVDAPIEVPLGTDPLDFLFPGQFRGQFSYGPAEGPPPMRPELPPVPDGMLRTACEALDDLLFQAGAGDPAAVEAAGAEVLRHCAVAPVDEAAGVEQWLLAALAAAMPRSDPLLEAAMVHFGWNRAVRSKDYLFNLDLDALLQRRAALAALRRCLASPFEVKGRAATELRRPGRTRVGLFDLGLAGAVRGFLERTLAEHPLLEHDLAPDTLAAWRGHFEGRHLPDNFWLMMLFIPLILSLIVWNAAGLDQSPAALGWTMAGSIAASLAGIMAFAELRARSAARRRDWDWDGREGRHAAPWLAAALLLPGAAAGFAVSEWTALAWNGAALFVAIGGTLNTRPPIGIAAASAQLGIAGFPALAAFAAATVAFAVPATLVAHLAGPMAVLCYLAYRTRETAALELGELPPALPRAIQLGTAALSLGAIATLFGFAPALPPPLLASVPAIAAAQHLATAPAHIDSRPLEWFVRVAAIAFHLVAGQAVFGAWETSVVGSILLYVLVLSLARTLFAAIAP